MNWGPLSRNLLRYGVGYFFGSELGEQLALDDDTVLMLSLAIGAAVEAAYALAKRKGWAT